MDGSCAPAHPSSERAIGGLGRHRVDPERILGAILAFPASRACAFTSPLVPPGWQDFPDCRDRIIRHSRTRVLAFLNIVAAGMGTGKEDDPAQMDFEGAAKMAKDNPGLIVGFKSAHYAGPGWVSIEGAVKALPAPPDPRPQ